MKISVNRENFILTIKNEAEMQRFRILSQWIGNQWRNLTLKNQRYSGFWLLQKMLRLRTVGH